jgi:ketosteroid isomerase-like protein
MPLTSLFPRARSSARGDGPSASSDVLEDVRRLNQEYIWAVLANDADWFAAHLAEDAVVVLGDGRRVGKAAYLRMLVDDPRRFEVLTVRDVTVRAFGPVVQVDADAPWTLADGTRGVSRYLDTWAWIDGRWRVVSAQITPLPGPPESA